MRSWIGIVDQCDGLDALFIDPDGNVWAFGHTYTNKFLLIVQSIVGDLPISLDLNPIDFWIFKSEPWLSRIKFIVI